MEVRAILDQKGLPRRLIQLSYDSNADVYIDDERVVEVEQGEGAATVRLHTDRSSLFILVDDYDRFLNTAAASMSCRAVGSLS